MNTENMNQNSDPETDQGTGEKTFTQEDVNRIVGERLLQCWSNWTLHVEK